ncbi:signal recognition particle 19 kDa protein-like [Daphnia carinata]|uniref:signal recognition particle 19 kDa protein-like n=1 Tax=Daphnia carinata TaxID=120202 RepID=UPI002579F2FC|nr:signal recognition particle 19 kDa protein-like [Daphnia carinata]
MAATFTRSSFNPNKKPSDPERWICIYPAYIDSSKTRVAGRRVPKSRAVERPTCNEISDVLQAANFKVGVEPKFYSRESSKEEEMRGRVRVQLKNEDGSPVNPGFPTRDSLFLYIGEKIPHLKSRVFKSSGDGQAAGQGGGGKKKGKGGRR